MKSGDASAFEPLYRRHVDQAVRVAYLITRSQQAAEDVVQEAFVQVLRRIGTLRDPEQFKSWFYSILHNAAKRYTRKGRGFQFFSFGLQRSDEVDDTAAALDEIVVQRSDAEAVRRLLPELPDLYREPLILRYYAELTEPQIAAVLGVPVGTVKSRLHAGRLRLGQLLGDGSGQTARRDSVGARG